MPFLEKSEVNLEIPSLELPIAHSFEIRDRQGQAVGLELSAVCPAQFPIEAARSERSMCQRCFKGQT